MNQAELGHCLVTHTGGGDAAITCTGGNRCRCAPRRADAEPRSNGANSQGDKAKDASLCRTLARDLCSLGRFLLGLLPRLTILLRNLVEAGPGFS